MLDWINKNANKYKKAIFLDRDGTINVDTHYTHKISDLKYFDDTISALKIFAKLDYNIIIATNQAGIALNYYSKEDMSMFNRTLVEDINNSGGRIDAVYFCSELERKNFISEEQTLDFYMKPNAGMLYEAAVDFELILENSFFIGDRYTDVEAGKRGFTHTVLLDRSVTDRNFEISFAPDYVTCDLLSAALYIKKICDSQPYSKVG